MRSTLYIKFIAVYIAFGFLSIFCVGTLTSHLLLNRIEDNISSSIYREASLFSNNYLPDFFSGELSVSSVRNQLAGMQDYVGASIWFVERDGTLIASSSITGHPGAPSSITDFNPTENGSSLYTVGTYHDFFNDKVMTVITPVTSGYQTNGYLLMHKPYDRRP